MSRVYLEWKLEGLGRYHMYLLSQNHQCAFADSRNQLWFREIRNDS